MTLRLDDISRSAFVADKTGDGYGAPHDARCDPGPVIEDGSTQCDLDVQAQDASEGCVRASG